MIPENGREHCDVCGNEVTDIGPWCKLYVTTRYCEPLRRLRRRIFEADAEGDGPMVNALCEHIRRITFDRFVP